MKPTRQQAYKYHSTALLSNLNTLQYNATHMFQLPDSITPYRIETKLPHKESMTSPIKELTTNEDVLRKFQHDGSDFYNHPEKSQTEMVLEAMELLRDIQKKTVTEMKIKFEREREQEWIREAESAKVVPIRRHRRKKKDKVQTNQDSFDQGVKTFPERVKTTKIVYVGDIDEMIRDIQRPSQQLRIVEHELWN